MKKRVICLLVLCLFMLYNTALAATWEYFGRGNSIVFGDYSAYIEKDSVLKNGENVIFWELQVFDNADADIGVKNDVFKIEAVASKPRQYRVVEYYSYDANGIEVFRSLKPQDFGPVDVHPLINKAIDLAMTFAQGRQNTVMEKNGTLRFQYEYKAGSYVRIVNGTVKDPQGLWQALLPLQPPLGARGGYGLIGDDGLLGQEPGFGLRQLGSIARRYLLFDSIYVVQPSGFGDIGIQGGVFTTVDALNDTTLGWVFFDLRPNFEADLKKHLNLAP